MSKVDPTDSIDDKLAELLMPFGRMKKGIEPRTLNYSMQELYTNIDILIQAARKDEVELAIKTWGSGEHFATSAERRLEALNNIGDK